MWWNTWKHIGGTFLWTLESVLSPGYTFVGRLLVNLYTCMDLHSILTCEKNQKQFSKQQHKPWQKPAVLMIWKCLLCICSSLLQTASFKAAKPCNVIFKISVKSSCELKQITSASVSLKETSISFTLVCNKHLGFTIMKWKSSRGKKWNSSNRALVLFYKHYFSS